MREYDFVFVYEVKNRELENDCLIAYELEKRGYKVGFIGTWDQERRRERPLKTKVVIAFALYNNSQLNFIDYHVKNCDKCLNMQWEQIGTNASVNNDLDAGQNGFGITGRASKAIHIAWGEVEYERLIKKYNINKNNISVCGHVALDFLRPQLREYYLSRDELFKEFDIDINKEICLFISSFGHVNIPESYVECLAQCDPGYDINKMIHLSVKSLEGVLFWIGKLLSGNKDLIFIYRPHPAENNNPVLDEMEKKFPNFRVIDKYSVKQWILTVDKLYTWMSTSIAEIYAAGKPCGILRPVRIPDEYDMEIYNNAEFIMNYGEFERTINCELRFPISEEVMNHYYSIDPDYPSYMRVCDLLEKIYKDDDIRMNCQHAERTEKTRRQYNRYIFIKRLLINSRAGNNLLKKLYPNRNNDLEQYLYIYNMYKKNHNSKKEIRGMIDKIGLILKRSSI